MKWLYLFDFSFFLSQFISKKKIRSISFKYEAGDATQRGRGGTSSFLLLHVSVVSILLLMHNQISAKRHVTTNCQGIMGRMGVSQVEGVRMAHRLGVTHIKAISLNPMVNRMINPISDFAPPPGWW